MPWQVGGYATEGEKPFDQGSFGTVWRARRLATTRPVALKLVLLTDAADARERIAAERHGAMLQQRFQQAHGMVPVGVRLRPRLRRPPLHRDGARSKGERSRT